MRVTRFTALGALAVFGLSGCAAMQEREWGRCGVAGAVIGGAAGALGGGLGTDAWEGGGHGVDNGELAAGAGVGLLVGAGLGAVAGHLLCDPKPQPPPPPPPPPPAPKPIAHLGGANFDFNKATLKPEGKKILDGAVKTMKDNPTMKVTIEGHTDSVGSDSYNQKLSERRAESAKDYLVSGGISAGRISTVGYGETKPVASNATEEGRAENRRVDLMPK
jgi:OmpA-OmpF porin, OOP family